MFADKIRKICKDYSLTLNERDIEGKMYYYAGKRVNSKLRWLFLCSESKSKSLVEIEEKIKIWTTNNYVSNLSEIESLKKENMILKEKLKGDRLEIVSKEISDAKEAMEKAIKAHRVYVEKVLLAFPELEEKI